MIGFRLQDNGDFVREGGQLVFGVQGNETEDQTTAIAAKQQIADRLRTWLGEWDRNILTQGVDYKGAEFNEDFDQNIASARIKDQILRGARAGSRIIAFQFELVRDTREFETASTVVLPNAQVITTQDTLPPQV